MHKVDYEEAEVNAGITELSKRWGFYLTYKGLANDDINKLSEVTTKSVYEVYTYLLVSKDQRDYEKRYQEIKYPKK